MKEIKTLIEKYRGFIDENSKTINDSGTSRMTRHRLEGKNMALTSVIRDLEYILED